MTKYKIGDMVRMKYIDENIHLVVLDYTPDCKFGDRYKVFCLEKKKVFYTFIKSDNLVNYRKVA